MRAIRAEQVRRRSPPCVHVVGDLVEVDAKPQQRDGKRGNVALHGQGCGQAVAQGTAAHEIGRADAERWRRCCSISTRSAVVSRGLGRSSRFSSGAFFGRAMHAAARVSCPSRLAARGVQRGFPFGQTRPATGRVFG